MAKEYQAKVLARVPELDFSFGDKKVKFNGLAVIADEVSDVRNTTQKEFVHVVCKSGVTYTLSSKSTALIEQCRVPGAVLVRIDGEKRLSGMIVEVGTLIF